MAATFPTRPSSPQRPERQHQPGAVGVVTAHTAGQIISVVTVQAVDQPAAVAVALAVVSEALGLLAAPAPTTPPSTGHGR
jgi:hypothetical protein